MLAELFEYKYDKMLNNYYFILNLKENEDFIYNQIDIKKIWAINNTKQNNNKINPMALAQYSDFTTPIVDKCNMQTIPGKK